jgi:short subunit dehydrogenase-like uncharacterized protein
MRRANLLRPLLRRRWVTALIKSGIQRRLQPPTQAQRDNNPSFVWGEVRNAAGRTVTAKLRTANGYALTVASSLAIITQVLRNLGANSGVAGYATPGMLVGEDFVSTLPGSSQIQLDA